MTAVTIQSNRVVSTEARDNGALLEPLGREKYVGFLANLAHAVIKWFFFFCNWHFHMFRHICLVAYINTLLLFIAK